ncbi:protein dbl-1-like [Argopecten irradians]|uniref:protein dbl-1-like n=1 Tax=Argopecten irradians TaxID=31199 RepID=UPI003720AC4B
MDLTLAPTWVASRSTSMSLICTGKIARWTTEGYALNVTKRVHNHLQSGHKTIRFRVCVQHREHLRCRGFGKFTIALVIQINVHMDASYEFSTEHINLLDMYRDRDKYQIRTKRSENDERTETPNQNTGTPLNTHVETPHCHVHPWILNFTDIGWNNVLVPQSFDANVCVGGCPSPLISIDSLNSTYHSNVVDLYLIYHNMTANGIPPAPSCTATELAPLSIMYSEDDGSVGLIKLEGIKVVACGCR